MKIFSTLIFGTLLACSNGGSSDVGYSTSESDGFMESFELEEAVYAPPTKQENPEFLEQKIIKTASIEFETREMDKTHQRIMQAVQKNKAFLQKDNAGRQYSREFRRLIIRVPTENFQALVDGIGIGVAYFDTKDITRKDVGEEFVDLQARLKAKRVLEERYLQLLAKAKDVKEMLEIERELSSIREEIEAKQGRLKYLQNQVSLSTIFLEFYKTDVQTSVTQSYGAKMGNALKGGWNGISAFFLNILYVWPFVLILGISTFFIRRYLKRNKKV